MKKTLLTLALTALVGCVTEESSPDPGPCKPALTTHAGAISCNTETPVPAPPPDCCELASTDIQAFRDQCGVPGKCLEFACSYGTPGVCLPKETPDRLTTVQPKL